MSPAINNPDSPTTIVSSADTPPPAYQLMKAFDETTEVVLNGGTTGITGQVMTVAQAAAAGSYAQRYYYLIPTFLYSTGVLVLEAIIKLTLSGAAENTNWVGLHLSKSIASPPTVLADKGIGFEFRRSAKLTYALHNGTNNYDHEESAADNAKYQSGIIKRYRVVLVAGKYCSWQRHDGTVWVEMYRDAVAAHLPPTSSRLYLHWFARRQSGNDANMVGTLYSAYIHTGSFT